MKAPLSSPIARTWAALNYRGRHRRRHWVGERVHVEVRGLAPDSRTDEAGDLEGRRQLARRVEEELVRVPGVRWAVANPVLGRVVVSLEPDGTAPAGQSVPAGVLAAIEAAEAAMGVADRRLPPGLPEHPADREPAWRALTALLGDAGGLGLAVASGLARRSPLPTDIAALVGLVDSQPRVRNLVADVVGPRTADLALAVANATAQGLAAGPIGVVTDLVWRGALLSEVSARQHSWALAEPELCGRPAQASAPFVVERARPTALPPGAVERYADRAMVASVGAGVSAAVTSGDVTRAAAGLYAGLPKAARMGREVFAVHVTRWLSSMGAVVLDAGALRRLDRVDTVLIDTAGWGRAEDPHPPAWAVTVVAAARRAGHMVAVAGDAGMTRALGADLSVRGGQNLADGVRDLQADGCVVLLVSGAGKAAADALWAADVAVGRWERGRGTAPSPDDGRPDDGRPDDGRPDDGSPDDGRPDDGTPADGSVAGPGRNGSRGRRPVPWSADVLISSADAWRVVEASGAASQVTRQSVALALIGAVSATAVVFGAPRSGRYGWAVNGAAVVSMANATRAAAGLTRRQEPVGITAVPPWHALGIDEVLTFVSSSVDGLTSEEAASRVPAERRSSPAFVRFLGAVAEELANPLTPVLAGGAALSAVLGGTVDAAIVAGVTTVNALLGGLQRWRTELAADSLAHAGDVTVHVLRDGQLVLVGTSEVVDGDVVVLRAGDVVPADARILGADGVLADESSLTGESLPVGKDAEPTGAEAVADRHSMLYGGTSIAAGEAIAVVVATGAQTEAGAAASGDRLIAGGVEARLGELTRRAIPLSVGAGGAVVAAGILRGLPLSGTLASGVSLAVAAVPEGLPLVATMAQLSAAGRLARQGALVRNHRAIEALGRVDVLCTDKTGTLTIGRLAVRAVSDLVEDADLEDMSASHRRVLGAALRATPAPEEGRLLAHPTDAAIVAAAATGGVGDAESHRTWTRIAELPFEPAQGFHATVGRVGRRRVVSVKGAPEVVLPRCSNVAVGGDPGHEAPTMLATIDADIERLARRGLRVLAVAEGTVDSDVATERVGEDAVTGLTLLGLVAIADPVRPEAASAVRGLQDAGVRVCMVTGDHPSTAEGIAAELGILNGHRVMGGTELATLDDAQLDEAIEAVSVFARVTPADKVRIVQSLRRLGRVVAMTGDGANDAPAIRLADVGVAMGSRSTPAAREAADVIVTNDDIETIIAAIVEGRALWGSVRDALSILLGGNLGEIAFILAGAGLSGSSPLNPRQLLLVNLLTDVAPALAIATRPPLRRRSEELLGEGPERSLGRPLERAILGRAALTAFGAGVAWLPARLTGGRRRASTVALVSLVGTQLAQTVTSGGTHPVVLLAGAGSAAVLVGIVQTPGLSQLFGCVPLDPLAWLQVGGGVGTATAVSLAQPVAASLGRRLSARTREALGRSREEDPTERSVDGPAGTGIVPGAPSDGRRAGSSITDATEARSA